MNAPCQLSLTLQQMRPNYSIRPDCSIRANCSSMSDGSAIFNYSGRPNYSIRRNSSIKSKFWSFVIDNTGRYVPFAKFVLVKCSVHSRIRRNTLRRSDRDIVVGNFIPSRDRATRIRVLTMYFPSGSASRFVTRRGLLMIVECRRRLALRLDAMVATCRAEE